MSNEMELEELLRNYLWNYFISIYLSIYQSFIYIIFFLVPQVPKKIFFSVLKFEYLRKNSTIKNTVKFRELKELKIKINLKTMIIKVL